MNALALRAPYILALGAGGCGIELGLKLVMPEARIVGYVEREAFAAANLAAKIEAGVLDEAPIWSDVATFDGRPYRGHVDIVSIGLPCQPFSTAGKRKGVEDERWLWPDVWRILRQVEPRYLFMEEVRGFVQSGFSYTLRDLADSGWSAEWDLFSAAAVGAPHKRERFFLLADSNREGLDGEGVHVSGRRPREAISDACGAGESLGHPDSAVPGNGQGGSSKGQIAVEGCDELDNSASTGRCRNGRPKKQGETSDDASSTGQKLGNTRHSSRGPEQGRKCEMSSSVVGKSGEGLANSESKRTRTRSMPRATTKEHSRACSRGSKLDDSLRGRHEQPKEKICAGRDTPFPPGPADTEAWRQILEINPSLEPAICRTSDGMANRLEQLRLCGNGVVPLVAAVAWRVLAGRFDET